MYLSAAFRSFGLARPSTPPSYPPTPWRLSFVASPLSFQVTDIDSSPASAPVKPGPITGSPAAPWPLALIL